MQSFQATCPGLKRSLCNEKNYSIC